MDSHGMVGGVYSQASYLCLQSCCPRISVSVPVAVLQLVLSTCALQGKRAGHLPGAFTERCRDGLGNTTVE